MPTSTPSATPTSSWRSYHRVTRTATYGFLSALPLLLLYEVMIVVANQGRAAQVRVSAEVWMKQVLAWVGAGGLLAFGIVVLLVGIGVTWKERKAGLPLRPRYFGWMIAESLVYAVVVALLVSTTVGLLFARVGPLQGFGLFTQLALSIGAGIYEELVFRVLLVGGLAVGLRWAGVVPRTAYIVAALVGAFLFSTVHYTGVYGDAWTLPSFTFRFLFGLALNVLFLLRGFGVAVWTHALYDVLVVTRLL